MILGMTTSTFTLLHVLISLVGIGSGLIVVYGMLNRKPLDAWTAIFLATTVLTSVTGYFFPFVRLLPSHIVGAISLVALAVAIFARYARHSTPRKASAIRRLSLNSTTHATSSRTAKKTSSKILPISMSLTSLHALLNSRGR